jgi:drug/metabolite transporter (DMT)-like permease
VSQHRITLQDYLVYVLLALIWGSSFILIKTGLKFFPPMTVAALRITIAGLVLVPFAINGLKQLTPKQQFYSVVMGLCGSGVPAFLFSLAQTRVESGIAGILNSLTPIFILVNGFLFYKVRYAWQQTVGVLVGFAGCAGLILLTHKPHGAYDNNYWYALLIVAATFLYGMSNQVLMHHLKGLSSLLITPVAFFYAGAAASVVLFSTGFAQMVQQPGAWQGVLYIALLASFGSAMAMLLYNHLAQRTGVAFAGTVTYVMPVVSLVWSFVDREYIGWEHFGAMALILLGVYLVRRK